LSQIQAKSKDEEDNKIKDLEAHNFELGLIKLAEKDHMPKIRKKGTKKEIKKSLKGSLISDHEDSLSRDGDDQSQNQSKVELNPIEEEEKEGGEKDDQTSGDLKPNSQITKNKSNATTVKLSPSVRLKMKNPNVDGPDSPLPRILINNDNEGEDGKLTKDPTPKNQDAYKIAYESDEDGPETSRQLQTSIKSKLRKKENFINLRAKYDGFNRLRFVYSRIIPK